MASLNPFDDSHEEDVKSDVRPSTTVHNKPIIVPTRQGSRYEPSPRFGHSTAVVREKLYLWGGWQKGFPQVHTSQEKTIQTLKIDVMNLHKGEWSQLETYGEPPLGVRGYATAVINDNLYYFGGYCGHEFCRHNTFKCLDTMTMEWKDVPSSNPYKSPMKKNACGMVSFKDDGQDYLFVCGGAGMLCSANVPDAIYIPWKENPDFGWTNESHIFELSTGSWITPTITGDQPPPSAGFTLTQISPNTAIYIGGFDSFTQECVQDIYKVELTRDTIKWTKLNIATPVDERPRPRHDHSAVCISDCTTEPCILIGGGRDVRWKSLDDVWALNCETGKWNKLEVPVGVAHRHFHSLSMFNINSNISYGVMFGGITEWEQNTTANDQPMIADTTMIELTRSNEGMWSVSAFLDSTMLSSTEEYKCRLIQRLVETIQKDNRKTIMSIDSSKQQDSIFEQTISDLQQQILSKDVQISVMETNIQQMTKQLDTSLNELSAIQALQNKDVPVPVQQAIPSLSPPILTHHPPQSELTSAISRVDTAEQLALECTQDILTPFLLSAHDVTISGSPIHKGAYGHTVIAEYRGTKVAAKILQQPPTSAFNKMVLMRELLKAVRMIHPNILLFLGAIVDNGIVIINESTISNLRYELSKKPFAKQDILDISNDIAKGLSYLHQAKPRPIIHRAVFTDNIFLEPLAFKWRAKLSDTILSNYYHYTDDSIMESVYCPPEAADLKLHTPKLDIYSFGIVLFEIVTRKLPPILENERDKILQSTKWYPLTELINDCLTEELSIRPTSDKILITLNKIQTK